MSPSLTIITSPSNPRLKLFRSLSGSAGVRKHGQFVMEGPRFIRDYISRPGSRPGFVLMSRDCTREALDTAELVSAAGIEILCLPETLFADLTDTAHTQGIAAVCPLPGRTIEEMHTGDRVLMLDNVADPGNVGTAIRSAAAFAVSGVVCGKGTCFPFTPRVTRAAVGLNAVVPVVFDIDTADAVRSLSGAGYSVVAADPGGMPPEELDKAITGRLAVIVGSEAHGLSREVTGLADAVVAIPMAGEVESLNAGVSASILLYVLTKRRAGRDQESADSASS